MAFIKILFFLFAVVFYFFCNSSMLFPVMFVLQFSFFSPLLLRAFALYSVIFFLLLETFLCLHRSVHFLFTFSVIWPRPMSIIKPLVRIIALWFNLLTIFRSAGWSVGSQSNCYKRTSMNRHHASTHTHMSAHALSTPSVFARGGNLLFLPLATHSCPFFTFSLVKRADAIALFHISMHLEWKQRKKE